MKSYTYKKFTKAEDDTLIKLHWHYGRNYLAHALEYLPERNAQSIQGRMHILRKRYHWTD